MWSERLDHSLFALRAAKPGGRVCCEVSKARDLPKFYAPCRPLLARLRHFKQVSSSKDALCLKITPFFICYRPSLKQALDCLQLRSGLPSSRISTCRELRLPR